MSSNSVANISDQSWGVLLLAHGAPDRLEDVPEFLLNVRGGRKLPDPVIAEIQHRYSLIGGGSPLLRLTALQADALVRELGRPVYVGMRNWKPFIPDAVRRMKVDQVRRVAVFCLTPQNSRTSIGLYRRYLGEAVAREYPDLELDFTESWHDHPGLIAAFAERLRGGIAEVSEEIGHPAPVVFTAHSVPRKTIEEGDPYEAQVRETATLVAQAIGLKDYRIAFQSQGMTAEPWIGPTVESFIDELAAAGEHHVLLAPVGFVCDHVEILYDIDVLFREYGRKHGVCVHRTKSLNDSPLFVAALAAIARERITAGS
jgi:protoporphyrin/coproporphyrin ferrochelatase